MKGMREAKDAADAARQDSLEHAPSRGRVDRTDPETVVLDETLTADQKRRFLEGWRDGLMDRESGHRTKRQSGDEGGNTALIARIEAALERLAGEV
jgi:hypothetical protein